MKMYIYTYKYECTYKYMYIIIPLNIEMLIFTGIYHQEVYVSENVN